MSTKMDEVPLEGLTQAELKEELRKAQERLDRLLREGPPPPKPKPKPVAEIVKLALAQRLRDPMLDLGVKENSAGEVEGFWSVRSDGRVYYTKVLREDDRVLSEYNPFSYEAMWGK